MPSLAESSGKTETKDPDVAWGSAHAMGCMMLRECVEGVTKVEMAEDFRTVDSLQEDEWIAAKAEVQVLLDELKAAGVEVYVGPGKYFMPLTRGVYKSDLNRMFFNEDYMALPSTVLKVLRHESWHAAQDCMAGTIDNNLIAIIMNPDKIPMIHNEMVDRTYTGRYAQAAPWEKEAHWAAATPWMTTDALRACNNEKPMWEQYTPTPLTRQYLQDHGFIK